MSNLPQPKINLIPDDRIRQRQQSLWIARWTTFVVVTTMMIGLPGIYIGGSAALTDSGMTEQINEVSLENTRHQQAIPKLRERIGLLATEQEVLDLVANRVEWRDVFGILVGSAANDVRFRRLSASGGGVEGTMPIEISIEGLAPTQTIARAYVVDLEATGLFDVVELIETTREQMDQLELIRFRILIMVNNHEASGGESVDAG